MTPAEMKAAAAECEKIARALGDRQNSGVFAPTTPSWSGTADDGSGTAQPVEFRVTEMKDGRFTAVLKVGGAAYAVTGTPDALSVRPVIDPQLTTRIVNATLSAANTFHFLTRDPQPQPTEGTTY